ncbi:MAG: hypothetical protein LBC99_08205 [Spirochaetota bacterium]|jgi:hypothetical protein|nr:hypothetical protein [Spirochaetota bacterium]
MKKHIAALGALLVLFGVPAFAAPAAGTTPTIAGGTGIITTPSAYTIPDKHIDLGFWWVNPSTLALSGGFGITERLELAAGFELDDSNADPFLHGRLKYRFSGANNGQDAWAIGINFDLALGDDADSLNDPGSVGFAPYIANTFFISGFQFNWGVGYTFGLDSHINFFVGISRMILKNIIFIDADLSNFSHRFNMAGAGHAYGNIALRFSILDSKLNISAGLYDAFETSRQFGAGVSCRL